jgi:hypothetical protein
MRTMVAVTSSPLRSALRQYRAALVSPPKLKENPSDPPAPKRDSSA